MKKRNYKVLIYSLLSAEILAIIAISFIPGITLYGRVAFGASSLFGPFGFLISTRHPEGFVGYLGHTAIALILIAQLVWDLYHVTHSSTAKEIKKIKRLPALAHI